MGRYELDDEVLLPIKTQDKKSQNKVKALVEKKAGWTLQREALRVTKTRDEAKILLTEWVDMLGLNGREIRLNDDHLTKFRGSRKPISEQKSDEK